MTDDFAAAQLRAAYYRGLAGTLRAHITELTDAETRDALTGLAAHYERLAEYVAPGEPPSAPAPGAPAGGTEPAF